MLEGRSRTLTAPGGIRADGLFTTENFIFLFEGEFFLFEGEFFFSAPQLSGRCGRRGADFENPDIPPVSERRAVLVRIFH